MDFHTASKPKLIRPNKRAAGKSGIPSLSTVGRSRPALPEHNR